MSKKQQNNNNKALAIVSVLAILVLIIAFIKKDDSPPITYTPPADESAEQTTQEEPKFNAINLKGSGSKLTEPFDLKPGGYKVTSKNTGGDSNFSVYVVNSEGVEEDLVANDIGDVETSTSINSPGGEYRFDVMSEGSWTIKIEAL